MKCATMQKKCKTCKTEFTVRVADHNRGWGKYCSKSCKAKKQASTQVRGLPRPNGYTPMRRKYCQTCGEPAVNGVYSTFGEDNGIEWCCERHMDDTHPFDMEG